MSTQQRRRRRPHQLFRKSRPALSPDGWDGPLACAGEEEAALALLAAERLADRAWRGYGRHHDYSQRIGARGRRVGKKALPI